MKVWIEILTAGGANEVVLIGLISLHLQWGWMWLQVTRSWAPGGLSVSSSSFCSRAHSRTTARTSKKHLSKGKAITGRRDTSTAMCPQPCWGFSCPALMPEASMAVAWQQHAAHSRAWPCSAVAVLARHYQPDLHINCRTMLSTFISTFSFFFFFLFS